MRLSEKEKQIIVTAVLSFDPDASIYLFGSRVNDKKRGGDIDLLVLSNKLTYVDKIRIKKYIFSQMDEQKIDIVISSDQYDSFTKMVKDESVLLA
jgi:predicted nucleotidyltransferase